MSSMYKILAIIYGDYYYVVTGDVKNNEKIYQTAH